MKRPSDTDLILSPPFYGYTDANHLQRTVAITPDGSGVTITRRYMQTQGGGLANPTKFSTRWQLRLPEPAKARIAVHGGGLDQQYTLGSQASPPARPSLGSQPSPPARLSDARPTSLPLAKPDGDVTIALDRGDGLQVTLTIPAAGWEAVSLLPSSKKQMLTVTLLGAPTAMNAQAKTLELPAQTLAVTAVHKIRAGKHPCRLPRRSSNRKSKSPVPGTPSTCATGRS